MLFWEATTLYSRPTELLSYWLHITCTIELIIVLSACFFIGCGRQNYIPHVIPIEISLTMT